MAGRAVAAFLAAAADEVEAVACEASRQARVEARPVGWLEVPWAGWVGPLGLEAAQVEGRTVIVRATGGSGRSA